MSNKNRTKGHNLERDTVRQLRDMFPKAKTTRALSRVLDDCKVDIGNVPILIQCKAGYEKRRPQFEKLERECRDLLKLNFLQDDDIHDLPYIIRHKFNKNDLAYIKWEFFMELYTFYIENNKEKFKKYK